MGRTIFYVVEDIEEDHLPFGFPFVFVYVRHDVFDGGQSSFQFPMIRIVLGGVLEEVCGIGRLIDRLPVRLSLFYR